MSAVSIKVTPASRAAWMVAIAWASSGSLLSLFIEIGIAPRPMAETVKGPSCLVCIPSPYAGSAAGPPSGIGVASSLAACRATPSTMSSWAGR